MGERLGVISMVQGRENVLDGGQKLIAVILAALIAVLRTREIRVRMAIGACPRHVLRGVLDQT
jgi:hypothetical protein